jgi:hypothetical protein
MVLRVIPVGLHMKWGPNGYEKPMISVTYSICGILAQVAHHKVITIRKVQLSKYREEDERGGKEHSRHRYV